MTGRILKGVYAHRFVKGPANLLLNQGAFVSTELARGIITPWLFFICQRPGTYERKGTA